MSYMSELLDELRKAIIDGDAEKAKEVIRKLLEQGVDPFKIVDEGLVKAMNCVGELYEKGEYFIPELILAAEAFKESFKIVKDKFPRVSERRKGVVVIGTVRGDIHELGKTLVATMLELAGFEVIDLGVDVPPEKFVEAAEKYNADIVGLSALMTTTMIEQRNVIEEFKKRGIRSKYKIIVGGAPVTEEWAKQIGADGYAPNAYQAVKLVERLIEEMRSGKTEAEHTK